MVTSSGGPSVPEQARSQLRLQRPHVPAERGRTALVRDEALLKRETCVMR
jgi:hypothetical protein